MTETLKESARHELPQISNHTEFLNDLKSKKIRFSYVKTDTNNLIPTQDELDQAKVKSIVNSGAYSPTSSIVVSSDNKIIDGHHRWAAMKQIGCQCSCIRVDLLYPELLDLLSNSSYIERKGMHV